MLLENVHILLYERRQNQEKKKFWNHIAPAARPVKLDGAYQLGRYKDNMQDFKNSHSFHFVFIHKAKTYLIVLCHMY